MNNTVAMPPPVSIAVVERDTGLSKDTLRVWERRYGFPEPLRDANGERVYPAEQVEKLRLVRRLMDNGHRPGKIVPRPVAELLALADELGSTGRGLDHGTAPDVEEAILSFVDLIKSHETELLRQELSRTLMRVGLEQFVIRMAAPLAGAVGEAWARGQLEIYEEHLFTEQLNELLRQAINSIPRGPESMLGGQTRPRILLTTFPQEPHALGLLMAEALLTLNGCACVSLGVQTPLFDIAQAAQAHRADVVALSFSPVMNPNQVIDGLLALEERLPDDIEVWAGGSSAALGQRALKEARRVKVLQQLSAIEPAVKQWRGIRTREH